MRVLPSLLLLFFSTGFINSVIQDMIFNALEISLLSRNRYEFFIMYETFNQEIE